ncbi:MAG TPA: hypothetical protein VN611_03225 [Patescibacteria group bacterium]|nr:hypothetical protein [Patescibacteria group bacterium]
MINNRKRGWNLWLAAVLWAGCFLFLTLGNTACALQPVGTEAPAPAVAERTIGVRVDSMAGVMPESAAEIQQAAEATQRFFAEQAGLQLNNPVTVVLVPDRPAFIQEVIQRFHISELEARRVAKGVDALAGNGLIVLNVSGVPTTRQRTFLTAHELTHQYQRLLAGNQAGQVKWMLEGMAEAVAAQVVDRQGYFQLQQYRDNWLNGLRSTGQRPGLEEMVLAQDWSRSLDRYGSPVTYKTAGLAVLLLQDQQGLKKICGYFSRLGQQESPENAFYHALGFSMADYVAEYQTKWLRPAS